MSKYTTELRFMLESQAELTENGKASDVNTVIENTREWLFNFDYPCQELTPSEKAHLEKHIMLHYFTREIGFETFGLFKVKLQSKLWDIMPKYEKLYAVEHMNLDFFNDVNYTKKLDSETTDDGTKKTTGSIEHQNSGKDATTTTGSIVDQNAGNVTNTKTGTVHEANGGTDTKTTNGKYKDTAGGTNKNLFSDTPQNEIDIDANHAYISSMNKDILGATNEREYINLQDQRTDATTKDTTYQNVQDVSADSKSTTRSYNNHKVENENNKKLVDTYNDLLDKLDNTNIVDLTEHVFGNVSGNNIEKLQKYKDVCLNIELMIINDLKDLFMLLW